MYHVNASANAIPHSDKTITTYSFLNTMKKKNELPDKGIESCPLFRKFHNEVPLYLTQLYCSGLFDPEENLI